MSEYRDELAAAHARIADLEEKLRAFEEAAHPPVGDGKFPELEAEVARLRDAADATKNARTRNRITLASAVFPLLGMVLSFLHLPILATIMSFCFIVAMLANMLIAQRLPRATARLRAAEQKLADARRIAELEQALRVRIAAPAAEARPSDPADEASGQEELSVAAAARR